MYSLDKYDKCTLQNTINNLYLVHHIRIVYYAHYLWTRNSVSTGVVETSPVFNFCVLNFRYPISPVFRL